MTTAKVLSMQSHTGSLGVAGKERVKLATSPNPFLGLCRPSTHVNCLTLPNLAERMSKTPIVAFFWHFPFQLSPNLDKTDKTTICLDEARSSQTRNDLFLPKTNLNLQNWIVFLVNFVSRSDVCLNLAPFFCLLFIVCTRLGPK